MDNLRAGSRGGVLDLAHLAHYTGNDPHLQAELLGLFGEQMSAQLKLLTTGVTGQDWAIATHTLKGAARAVGAWSVAAVAEELEQLDPATQSDLCAGQLRRLQSEADACRAAIEQICEAA